MTIRVAGPRLQTSQRCSMRLMPTGTAGARVAGKALLEDATIGSGSASINLTPQPGQTSTSDGTGALHRLQMISNVSEVTTRKLSRFPHSAPNFRLVTRRPRAHLAHRPPS